MQQGTCTAAMRKTLIVLVFAIAFGSVHAQQRPYRIGIKGGVNYIHLENYGDGYYSDFDAKAGYSVGVLFQYRWGGFVNYSIVPEVLFTESVTDVDMLYLTDCPAYIQTLDIPVSGKVGLQLSKVFRPYILGNIYGSYIVSYAGDFLDMLDIDSTSSQQPLNRFYFGVSAGLGFDLWKFQFEGRYRWNLNRIISDDYKALKQMGLELSVAFLF
jgi:hypothetical protein